MFVKYLLLERLEVIFTCMLLLLVGCKTTTEQPANEIKYKGESTLVIIDGKQIFTTDSKKYTDTLSAKYFYEVLTRKDEIRRYTGLKTIKKVIVIN